MDHLEQYDVQDWVIEMDMEFKVFTVVAEWEGVNTRTHSVDLWEMMMNNLWPTELYCRGLIETSYPMEATGNMQKQEMVKPFSYTSKTWCESGIPVRWCVTNVATTKPLQCKERGANGMVDAVLNANTHLSCISFHSIKCTGTFMTKCKYTHRQTGGIVHQTYYQNCLDLNPWAKSDWEHFERLFLLYPSWILYFKTPQ